MISWVSQKAALSEKDHSNCQHYISLFVCLFVCTYVCRDEINKAYKHMAVLLHPDKNLAPGSEEAFKCIAKAREELLKSR